MKFYLQFHRYRKYLNIQNSHVYEIYFSGMFLYVCTPILEIFPLCKVINRFLSLEIRREFQIALTDT